MDTEEQIEILAGIIDAIIDKVEHPQSHPQASFNSVPNPEKLMAEVTLLKQKWDNNDLSFEEKNLIKDQLRHLQTRCNWISNQTHKNHLQSEIETLWEKILQTL